MFQVVKVVFLKYQGNEEGDLEDGGADSDIDSHRIRNDARSDELYELIGLRPKGKPLPERNLQGRGFCDSRNEKLYQSIQEAGAG